MAETFPPIFSSIARSSGVTLGTLLELVDPNFAQVGLSLSLGLFYVTGVGRLDIKKQTKTEIAMAAFEGLTVGMLPLLLTYLSNISRLENIWEAVENLKAAVPLGLVVIGLMGLWRAGKSLYDMAQDDNSMKKRKFGVGPEIEIIKPKRKRKFMKRWLQEIEGIKAN